MGVSGKLFWVGGGGWGIILGGWGGGGRYFRWVEGAGDEWGWVGLSAG